MFRTGGDADMARWCRVDELPGDDETDDGDKDGGSEGLERHELRGLLRGKVMIQDGPGLSHSVRTAAAGVTSATDAGVIDGATTGSNLFLTGFIDPLCHREKISAPALKATCCPEARP